MSVKVIRFPDSITIGRRLAVSITPNFRGIAIYGATDSGRERMFDNIIAQVVAQGYDVTTVSATDDLAAAIQSARTAATPTWLAIEERPVPPDSDALMGVPFVYVSRTVPRTGGDYDVLATFSLQAMEAEAASRMLGLVEIETHVTTTKPSKFLGFFPIHTTTVERSIRPAVLPSELSAQQVGQALLMFRNQEFIYDVQY